MVHEKPANYHLVQAQPVAGILSTSILGNLHGIKDFADRQAWCALSDIFKCKGWRMSGFSKSVRAIIAERASYICSNPGCRCPTLHLVDIDQGKAVFRGKTAHICAATENGARYDAQMNGNQRKAIDNAIFLCVKCADLVNRNKGIDHPVSLLRSWKEQHKKWVREHLDRRIEAPVTKTSARKAAAVKSARTIARTAALRNPLR